MDFLSKLAQKVKDAKDRQAEFAVKMLEWRVEPEVQKQRMDICLACDKLYKPTSSCKLCGCFMQVKTWMPDQNCPIDKWGKAPKRQQIKSEQVSSDDDSK